RAECVGRFRGRADRLAPSRRGIEPRGHVGRERLSPFERQPCYDGDVDGIHDLGGIRGVGPGEVERDRPGLHHAWEGIAFRLNALGIAALHTYNADEYRHAVERMEPAHYLAATYYERVLTGVATLLVEKGVVTHAEVEARAGGPFPLARPVAGRPTSHLD